MATITTRSAKLRVAAILCITLPLALGCGARGGAVADKVTYRGEPLPYGNVQSGLSYDVKLGKQTHHIDLK